MKNIRSCLEINHKKFKKLCNISYGKDVEQIFYDNIFEGYLISVFFN